MADDRSDRLQVEHADLRGGVERLVVTPREVAVTPPPLPPPVVGEGGGSHWSGRRVFLTLAIVVVLIAGAATAGILLLLRPTQVHDAGAITSVRLPTDVEQVLIDRGDLGLVAPSVFGRSEGFLGSEWSGTAIPWKFDDRGRLLLVTNRHVGTADDTVADSELTIEFAGGLRKPVVAIGVAADGRLDLAILAVDGSGLVDGTHYRLVSPMGDKGWSTLQPGDPVVAIGSPHGYPQTQTFGRIAALRDGLTVIDGDVRWIQVDCTVLSGNSGGPLLKADGPRWRWIGIVTARGEIGIGFAIFVGEVDETKYRWIVGKAPEFE